MGSESAQQWGTLLLKDRPAARVHYRTQVQKDFLFDLNQVKNNYTKLNWAQILKIDFSL